MMYAMTSFGVMWTAAAALILSSCELGAGSERVLAGGSAMTVRIEKNAADRDALKVVIVSDGTFSAGLIPFLQLRETSTGEEYWSPFDDRGRPLVVNGRVPVKRGVTEIPLRLSRVKWAQSRAALWPSRKFRDVIPPGNYEVVATLSPVRGPSVESNRVTLIVGRAQ
ncbi:MAG TPA: hypothetical protein VGF28_16910 [Thermoanaerobaculia bacterium]|jgi:hypothetical protein